jgi:hypothetical protein
MRRRWRRRRKTSRGSSRQRSRWERVTSAGQGRASLTQSTTSPRRVPSTLSSGGLELQSAPGRKSVVAGPGAGAVAAAGALVVVVGLAGAPLPPGLTILDSRLNHSFPDGAPALAGARGAALACFGWLRLPCVVAAEGVRRTGGRRRRRSRSRAAAPGWAARACAPAPLADPPTARPHWPPRGDAARPIIRGDCHLDAN